MIEYLRRYCDPLPPGIVVEWCPSEMNVKVPSPEEGVYFHPQVLASRVHLSLTNFIHHVLAYYNVTPTQLTPMLTLRKDKLQGSSATDPNDVKLIDTSKR